MPFQPSDRIQALPPYLFVEIDRRKRAALAADKDVIDFGVGDPERPTPDFVVERLAQAARKPANHRYPHQTGSPALRKTVAAFLARRYGVELDPLSEILILIGSKEGLGHLPLALVNPGQAVLVPDPGYPVYTSATIFAGGSLHRFDLSEERGWLPDLGAIPSAASRAAVLMYVNYPSNPIGTVAPLSFYEELVRFAREYDIVVAQDAAYNEMYFHEPPPSILQVEGAREVAIEFHSASKSFNMTGWRVAFAAGNAEVVSALARIKANLDSGQFTAIQEAAGAAFERYDCPEVARTRAVYEERVQLMTTGLRALGFRVQDPRATFYVWAGLPAGYDSMGAVSRLIEEAAIIAAPGNGFGCNGEGYIRFALTVEIERVREALERMQRMSW